VDEVFGGNNKKEKVTDEMGKMSNGRVFSDFLRNLSAEKTRTQSGRWADTSMA
jgi:hypothetical protein